MKAIEARKPWVFPMPKGLEHLDGRETPLVSPNSEDTPVFQEVWRKLYDKPHPASRPPQRRKVKDAPQV